MKCIEKIYKWIIVIFMLLIMGYLTVNGLFVRADLPIDGVTEKTVFHKSFWPVLLLLTAVLVWAIARNRERISRLDSGKLVRALLVFDFLLCMLWVVLCNTHEGADQAQVLYAAKQFSQGNYLKLLPDQYMGMYPFQLPLALLYEPFYLLFGDVTPFLWQFINAFLICGIQYVLYLLVCKMTEDRAWINLFLLLQFLDLPLILYVSFVYGTLIGLFLALIALYLLEEYGRKGGLRRAVGAAVCIAAACLLRTNNSIFLIALCIVSVLLLFKKRWGVLVFAALAFILFAGGRQGVYRLYEWRSGMEICEGEPSTLWIAMGLSPNEERAAGWYNGYTWDTYLELDCDTKAAESFARERIGESLAAFGASAGYTARFFGEKINSTWLNPDFQALWNNSHHGHYVACAPVIYNLFTGELHTLAELVLHVIQFLVYMGALLYFWGHRKKIDWTQCSLALVFIGGFLFHLFWETKAQYVITYYVLLFPYAAGGYLWLADKLRTCVLLKKAKQHK